MKQHSKIIVRILRIACFLLIFTMIFTQVSSIFARKSLAEPWNMSVKVGGFYNEPEHSIDVMYFGSSHMYCSIDPILMEEQTGKKGYILATQEQPLWLSYYYMIEALKTQNPEIIVLEVNMMTQSEEYAEEGTNYSALDPIPLSKNKMNMVMASTPEGERRNYLFNLFKYHGRWEELNLEDYKQEFKEKADQYRGYVKLMQVHPLEASEDASMVTEIGEPLQKNMEYLEKICLLAQENNSKLVFLKAPSNPNLEEQKMYNAAWQFAEQKGVAYVDYNRGIAYTPKDGVYQIDTTQIGLDRNYDFYDQHHLNYNGVVKLTPVFGEFLKAL